MAVVDFYAFHAGFVQTALAVSRAIAEAYCVAQADEVGRAIAAAQVPQLLASWEADAHAKLFAARRWTSIKRTAQPEPKKVEPHLDYTAEQLKDFGYSPR
jgi:hypothetical protein